MVQSVIAEVLSPANLTNPNTQPGLLNLLELKFTLHRDYTPTFLLLQNAASGHLFSSL